MAYIDAQNLYAGTISQVNGDLVAQGPITADAPSENVIDHGQAGYGEGETVDVIIEVIQAFNNLTSLAIILQTDDAAGFASPAEERRITPLLADLTAGKKFRMRFDSWSLEQFSRLNFDVTGTAPTTGTIIAYLAPADFGIQTNIAGRMDQYGQL